MINHILVVCVGNICRSPMAEYFLKNSHSYIQVQSAGLAAVVGKPADDKAIASMTLRQIDINAHIAQQISEKLIKKADLILVMTHKQQQHIEYTWPYSKGKVFRLGHWQDQNIEDPYQHDQEFFEHTCDLIQNYVLDWSQHL